MTAPRYTQDLSATLDHSGKNVVEIIKSEHRLVRSLFKAYNEISDAKEKQGIAHNIIKLLSVHGACEEMTIYPHLKSKGERGVKLVNHGLHEHQKMKEDLAALDAMTYGDAGYDDKLGKAIKDTLHHVEEEESNLLPELERLTSVEEMTKLTDNWFSVKKIAPSRPHPSAPCEPPMNKVANATATPLDYVRDAGRFAA